VPPMDDEPKRTGSLPDPELNPMMNPTLGKNLGRWAQVYFTSPPEKREEAVQELLRELENGRGEPDPVSVSMVQEEEDDAPFADDKSALPGFTPALSTASDEEQFVPDKAPDVSYRGGQELFPDEVEGHEQEFEAEERPAGEICPACLHKNDSGQRFCGFCGFSLSSSVPEQRRIPTPPAPIPPPAPPQLAPVRPASRHIEERDAQTWQWLHEKKLAELAAAQERKGRWIVPTIAILVLVLGGGYLYMKSRELGPQASTVMTATPQNDGVQPARRNTAEARPKASGVAPHTSQRPQPKQQAVPQKQAAPPIEAQEAQPQPPMARNVTPKTPSSVQNTTAEQPSGTSTFQEGTQELAMGRRYLNGDGVSRDHATAAKWLWKSVGKQNPDAVLLLSDLYVRGDGVPQSCDQARILLTAAAKRGSPGAADKLRITLATCP